MLRGHRSQRHVTNDSEDFSDDPQQQQQRPYYTYLWPFSAAGSDAPSASFFVTSLSKNNGSGRGDGAQLSRYGHAGEATPTEAADVLREALLDGEGIPAVREFLSFAAASSYLRSGSGGGGGNNTNTNKALGIGHAPSFSSSSSSLSSSSPSSPYLSINSPDSRGDTALHIAARRNDGPLVAFLLRETAADLSARNAKGQTALHVAAGGGCEDAVRLLLAPPRRTAALTFLGGLRQEGVTDVGGCSVRHGLLASFASSLRRFSTDSPLLPPPFHRGKLFSTCSTAHSGGSLAHMTTAPCALGLSPLYHAAAFGHSAVVRAMLPFYGLSSATTATPASAAPPPHSAAHRAAVTEALHAAASMGKLDCVRAIVGSLEATVDGSETKKMSSSAEGRVVQNINDVGRAPLSPLASAAVFARSPTDGRTLLHSAAFGGHRNIVAYVLALAGVAGGEGGSPLTGGDVNASAPSNLRGGTAVSTAALLLEEADSGGCTPLHIACREGSDAAVALLLGALGVGARREADASSPPSPLLLSNLNRIDASGNSALILAAKNGHARVVRALLEAWGGGRGVGAGSNSSSAGTHVHHAISSSSNILDGDQADEHRRPIEAFANFGNTHNGDTALHAAALYGHAGAVRVLLEEGGADPRTSCYGGVTPLHKAAQGGSAAVVSLLARALLFNPQPSSSSPSSHSFSSSSLTQSAAVSAPSLSSPSALTSSNASSPPPNAAYAAEDAMNARDSRGLTPLHTAVMFNNYGAAKALLDAGALVASASARDSSGRTPRDYANAHRRGSKVALLLNSYSVRFTDCGRRARRVVFPNGAPAVVEWAAAKCFGNGDSVHGEGSGDVAGVDGGDCFAESGVSSVGETAQAAAASLAPPTTAAAAVAGQQTAKAASTVATSPSSPSSASSASSSGSTYTSSTTTAAPTSLSSSSPSLSSRDQQRAALHRQLYLALTGGMCVITGTMAYLVYSMILDRGRQAAMEEEMRRAEAEADPDAEWDAEAEEVAREDARRGGGGGGYDTSFKGDDADHREGCVQERRGGTPLYAQYSDFQQSLYGEGPSEPVEAAETATAAEGEAGAAHRHSSQSLSHPFPKFGGEEFRYFTGEEKAAMAAAEAAAEARRGRMGEGRSRNDTFPPSPDAPFSTHASFDAARRVRDTADAAAPFSFANQHLQDRPSSPFFPSSFRETASSTGWEGADGGGVHRYVRQHDHSGTGVDGDQQQREKRGPPTFCSSSAAATTARKQAILAECRDGVRGWVSSKKANIARGVFKGFPR